MVVGVVRVSRAEQVLDRRVVLGLLISVADQQANRAAGGAAFEHAGEDFDLVRLLALGSVPAGAGLAPVEVMLQIGQGDLQARRASIDNGDQRRAMAFASGGDSEQLAVGIAGHGRSASLPEVNESGSIRKNPEGLVVCAGLFAGKPAPTGLPRA
ncbi:hypothetical protein D3C81_1026830 [compost metagenome]